MIRYTDEQKAQALQSIQEIGVAKTNEALGISIQTLYKWKNETGAAQPKTTRTRRKKNVETRDVADVTALLKDDDGAAEKLAQLEAENLRLRDANAKLRRALAAFLAD